MGTSLRRSETGQDIRDPYIFRFRCQTCGAERDQKLYRQVAQRIRCICGGDALRTSEAEEPVLALSWWTKNGKLVSPEQSYVWLKANGEKHRREGKLGRRSAISIVRSWLGWE